MPIKDCLLNKIFRRKKTNYEKLIIKGSDSPQCCSKVISDNYVKTVIISSPSFDVKIDETMFASGLSIIKSSI
ncbi:hypothetical protein LPICM17_70041 [Lactococcus piscium]|jgi:hypothetical protein|nr:hypothetical protein BHS00_09030 [Lactococcus carnosus]SOB48967.1 hypothetical protein LPICM17_70041 [Lactococcus piscium]